MTIKLIGDQYSSESYTRHALNLPFDKQRVSPRFIRVFYKANKHKTSGAIEYCPLNRICACSGSLNVSYAIDQSASARARERERERERERLLLNLLGYASTYSWPSYRYRDAISSWPVIRIGYQWLKLVVLTFAAVLCPTLLVARSC